MGFMDKVKAAAKNADSKAGEEIDKGKYKSKISDERKKITEAYEQIGKKYYDGFKDGAIPEEELKALCDEIDQSFANIAEYEKTIVEIEEKGKAEREKNNAEAEAAARERAEAKAAARAEREAKKAEEANKAEDDSKAA